MARRRLAWLMGFGILLGSLGACSLEEAVPVPYCEGSDSGLIVAQSVPTADLVPCLTALPAGWDADAVNINQDGTVVLMDSDRAGLGSARLHYGATCDIGEAVSVPSDQDGAEAFEYIEQVDPGFRARRYYTFSGGCVWWVFEFDAGASATHSIELQDQLVLISRQIVNENVRQNFIDEEL